ncbi:MAG: hypothetical protein AB7V32_08770 [Candidatus Berkiella sp.]
MANNDKSPDIEVLQAFLAQAPVDEIVTRLSETLRNRETIRETFFRDNANHYLPMLEEARKKGDTFNTLTRQVEKQCGYNKPDSPVAKNR